ncbi:DUF7504 family protein [Halarchaeum sp. P4]|uniref:DUF7504 family protein n=1 Tax=Halarchaeum sp. P4 TaxID=3421639 RepID=UPI003EB9FEA3
MNTEHESPLASLEPGSVVLYEHPSGERVVESLPRDAFDNLLVLTTRGDLARLERTVTSHGGTPGRVGVVPITGATVDYTGPLWITKQVAPSDLTGISIRFSEAFRHVEPGAGWVVVDNLGVLAMYVEEERLYRLVDSIASAVRKRDARCVLATTTGVLGERSLARLRDTADEKITR